MEKVRIQTSTLIKGNAQYKDRVNEIRILKIKLQNLNRDHAILEFNCKNINVLKREIQNINKELNQEKTKVSIYCTSPRKRHLTPRMLHTIS
jgi:hypothetical protein